MLASHERVVSPMLEVETMLGSRPIKRVNVGQSVASERPATSGEGHLHARAQSHVCGRVCSAGV